MTNQVKGELPMTKKMNMAAYAALANGDFDNAQVAMTPGGIERQEAQGQRDLVKNARIPKDVYGHNLDDVLSKWGIETHESVDDLFVQVELPDGWQLKATDHSMHSDLLDDKGRVRASIFYKAAFYDRCADMALKTRYTFTVEPVNGWQDYDCKDYVCKVMDQGKVLWVSDVAKNASFPERDELGDKGKAYLDKRYPEWRSPFAYWDTLND